MMVAVMVCPAHPETPRLNGEGDQAQKRRDETVQFSCAALRLLQVVA